jgi:hypothetical protein
MKRHPAVAAFLIAACSSASFAGIGEGQGELGFDFGVTSYDEEFVGQSGAHLKVRGGYHFSERFQLEGQLGYSAHFDEDALRSRGGATPDRQLRVLFVDGVFNFHSSSGNLVPYVLAGVGVSTSDFSFRQTDTSAAWQAAGGSRFFFGDRDQVAFRLEAALIFEKTFDQSKRHASYVAGFTWRLGKGSGSSETPRPAAASPG